MEGAQTHTISSALSTAYKYVVVWIIRATEAAVVVQSCQEFSGQLGH